MLRKFLLFTAVCALTLGGYGCGGNTSNPEEQLQEAQDMQDSGQPLSRQQRDELEEAQSQGAESAQ